MAEKALFSPEICHRIGAEIAVRAGAEGCNTREIQEGMIHAWRCYLTGGSAERAVRQGVLHAETLRDARGLGQRGDDPMIAAPF